MSPLVVLMALVSALVGAVVANLVASAADRWSSSSERYALWSCAFWSAPLFALLTATATLASGDRLVRPPKFMVQAAHAADHSVVAGAVMLLLAAIGVGAFCKGCRLLVATARATAMVSDARRDEVRRSAPFACGRGSTPVLRSGRVDVPILAGVFRSVVLMPNGLEDRLPPRQIELIRMHELVHARRRDNLRLWLEEAAMVLLWWSPPSRSARRRVAAAREISCDSIVLEASDLAERTAYARALLEVMGRRPRLATAYSNGDAEEVGHRIRCILEPGSRGRSALPIAVASLALLASAFPLSRSAGAAIAFVDASFAESAVGSLSFQRTGTVDPRTGRRLFEVRYGPARDPAERVLASPRPSEIAPVEVDRVSEHQWRIKVG